MLAQRAGRPGAARHAPARRARAGAAPAACARGLPCDVIAVTAARDVDVVKRAVSQGVVLYLLKPFTYAGFRTKLDQYADYRARLTAGEGDVGQDEVDQMLGTLRTTPQPHGGAQGDERRHAARGDRRAARRRWAAPRPSWRAAIGTSRVTARRYLEYLAAEQVVERPCGTAAAAGPRWSTAGPAPRCGAAYACRRERWGASSAACARGAPDDVGSTPMVRAHRRPPLPGRGGHRVLPLSGRPVRPRDDDGLVVRRGCRGGSPTSPGRARARRRSCGGSLRFRVRPRVPATRTSVAAAADRRSSSRPPRARRDRGRPAFGPAGAGLRPRRGAGRRAGAS